MVITANIEDEAILKILIAKLNKQISVIDIEEVKA